MIGSCYHDCKEAETLLSQAMEQVEHLKHSLATKTAIADQELQAAQDKLCRLAEDRDNQIQLAESKPATYAHSLALDQAQFGSLYSGILS